MEIKIPFIGKYLLNKVNLDPNNTTKTKETTIESPNGPLPISGGRNSDPDLPFSLLDLLIGEAAIIPPEYQIELIGILEHLGKFNPDVSYAVDNIVQLGNTEFEISFNDGISDAQVKLMRDELNLVQKDWYAYSGGIKSLRNDLLAQASITGAISAEAVPDNNLKGIRKIVLVSPKNIRFAYDAKVDNYEPFQKLSNQLMGIRRDANNGLVKLNTSTYKYYAVRRFNESPYAIPPFLSALDAICIEKDMLDNLKHVVKKLGVLGFLQVLVKVPAKTQVQTPEQYANESQQHLIRAGEEVDKGLKKGYVIGYKDQHEFTMQSTTADVSGASELMKTISEIKIAGLKQDPLMLGRNYSTSETVGRVILAKLSAQLQNYQMLMDTFLGEIMYLHLMLKGFKNLQYVKVESRKPLLADESKEQDAFSKKIDNMDKLYKQGVISQTDRAQALGFDEPDEEEPRAEVIPVAEDSTTPVDEGNLDPKADGSKTNDPTAVNDEKLIRLPENIVTALQAKEQHNLHIDLEVKGKKYSRYELIDNEFIASDGFSSGDILDFYIADDQVQEALDVLLEELRADVNEFTYTDGAHVCAGGHGEIISLVGNSLLDKYINKYGRDIQANFDKAVKKVVNAVGKELIKFKTGASLQEVQDSVLYTIYKTWRPEFTEKNRKYINKWVQDSYKTFRGDKTIFPSGVNIPKVTFNLKDLRTIEYYKKSDSLYLGKFITDEDTKIRITEYIKKQYLDESLPIGGKEVAAEFKATFGETLLKENYKINRIISTTVNKMRNTASVNYMQEAEIEKFQIVGLGDRLQCAYCAELNGKQFSVSSSVTQTSSLSESDPAEVKEKTPFATSIFKNAEEMKSYTPDQLQDKGISTPPFHPSCRCSVIAVL